MDLRFLRLRRWLLKQQPDKTVFNRFIKNWYQIWFNLYDPAAEDAIYKQPRHFLYFFVVR